MMVNILFAGHDFKFLQYLIDYYQGIDGIQVKLDHTGGHHIANLNQSAELLKVANLIFCEWALGNAMWYSANKRPDQKLVVRLHAQEINLDFLYKIKWENVDHLIFICEEKMKIFLRRFPMMKDRTSLIYNLIDCNILDKPKLPGAIFNLGFIGISPRSKGAHLALDLLVKLRQIDDRYKLYFKGRHPYEYKWLMERDEERSYFYAFYQRLESAEFARSVVFDPHGNDMPDWFSRIGYILSTSYHEGSHQAVAEGMAAGCLPVIRNWAGADTLYPKEFIVRTVDEAVEFIKRCNHNVDRDSMVSRVKKYAGENFHTQVITAKYDELFNHLFAGSGLQINEKQAFPQQMPVARQSVVLVCYLTPGNQNGYEIRVIEEAKALRQNGVSVFIAVYISKAKKFESMLVESFRVNFERMTGATVFIFETDHFFHLDVSNNLLHEIDGPLKLMMENNQITIIHAEAFYAAYHSLRISRDTQSKVVFDIHGILAEETMMRGGNPAWINRINEVEGQLLRDVDACVMVSNSMQAFLEKKHGLKVPDYKILPCCVHSQGFGLSSESRELIREKKGFRDKFVLIYLGSLSVWQWPEAMFTLFAELHSRMKDSIFYLLIPEYDHSKAHEYIAKFNLPHDSYLLEEVPHSEVGGIIGVADAGLLLRESHDVNTVSSPTKFGEYLAAGLPVILTGGIGDYSAMTDELNIGLTVSLNEAKPEEPELLRLISFISDIRNNREIWATRCRKAAVDFLEWDHAGKQLSDLYQKIRIKI